MPITARAASDKINEIRSKLAIYSTWAEVIHHTYLPSDGGDAEVRIVRADGGHVSEAHLEAVLEDIAQKSAELNEELAEWEGLVFEPPSAQVHPIKQAAEAATPEQEPAPQPAKKAQGPERSKVSARRLHPAAK